MVDMCREKTGMAKECCRSDGNRVLRACTECGIYWEPVEFFWKTCDMIRLWFFKMSHVAFWIFTRGVLELLYARSLFIGYTCKSNSAAVQSWCDHRRNKLFCGIVRQERTDRHDSPECKKRGAAKATNVLFHWQCLVKMHSKVRNSGLKRNATSTYICRQILTGKYVPAASYAFNTNRQNVPTACEIFNTNRQNVQTACETFNTNRQTTPNPLRFAPRISQPFHFKLCN